MKETVGNTEIEYSDLKRDVEQFKNDLRQLMEDMSGMGRNAMHSAQRGLREGKECVGDSLKSATDKGREAAATVGDQVSMHPLTSLAAALGVGIVIGMGLSRKG